MQRRVPSLIASICTTAGHRASTLISAQHEQKHLLYHRSDCRYRDRAQIARPLLAGTSVTRYVARFGKAA